MRELERPEEAHALREIRLEGLEAVLDHADAGLRHASEQGDLRLARLYARQQDRAAAELLARRLERDGPPEPGHEDLL